MRVHTYNLEGHLGPDAELVKDAHAQLWLNQTPVLAVSLWKDYVALTLTERLVLVAARDYMRIAGYGAWVLLQ